MFKKNKKGISPLIATVLIIGFTIVLAALVITWGTKLFKTTVGETETAAKFNLACTTGLRLDATADTTTDTATQINLSLRNNNQDRAINNFRFILYDSDGRVQQVNTPGTAANQFAAYQGGATPWNGTEAGMKLDFPVPKIYRLWSDGTAPNAQISKLTKVEVYPIFTIEGTTKACESPTEVRLV